MVKWEMGLLGLTRAPAIGPSTVLGLLLSPTADTPGMLLDKEAHSNGYGTIQRQGKGPSPMQHQILTLKRLRLPFSKNNVCRGIPLAEAHACLQLAILTGVFTGHKLPSSVSPPGRPREASTLHPSYGSAGRSREPRGRPSPARLLPSGAQWGRPNHSQVPGRWQAGAGARPG